VYRGGGQEWDLGTLGEVAMDLRLAQYIADFELHERWRTAERLHVQVHEPISGRIADALTAGLGHMLVRVGSRLEAFADHCLADDARLAINPDPCNGCAN
jgi:hypothetical protein